MAPADLSPSMAHRRTAVVDFLSRPSTYAESLREVEVRETHMSWVFLAGSRVFKLKKPVRAAFLDFSSLKARKRSCRKELSLNRRLAPNVYVRVLPVTQEEEGGYALDGKGVVADWLVEMRRLPEHRMLDRVIAAGALCETDLARVLDLLFTFFITAPPVRLTKARYLAILKRQHEESGAMFLHGVKGLDSARARETLTALQDTLERAPEWLFDALAKGRIIEGHGDLRPEHVCLCRPPAIIDCIEFNRDLRLVDPFDELSYLALECKRLGAMELADTFVPRYASISGVNPPSQLLDFYTAYRGLIRARLALAHLFDWPGQDGHWTNQANDYLKIAHEPALKLRRQ